MRATPVKRATAGVVAFDLQADSVGARCPATSCGGEGEACPSSDRPRRGCAAPARRRNGLGEAELPGDGHQRARPPNGQRTSLLGQPPEPADYRVRGRESRDSVYFGNVRLVRAGFLTAQPGGMERRWWSWGPAGRLSGHCRRRVDALTFFAAGVPAGCDPTGFKAGRTTAGQGSSPPASSRPRTSPKPSAITTR